MTEKKLNKRHDWANDGALLFTDGSRAPDIAMLKPLEKLVLKTQLALQAAGMRPLNVRQQEEVARARSLISIAREELNEAMYNTDSEIQE
jgi:hypothetical protein